MLKIRMPTLRTLADDSAQQAEPEAHVEISPWGNAVPSDSKE
jgi:hypothetical protein